MHVRRYREAAQMAFDLVRNLQKLEAQLAVGPSTARGQGQGGIVNNLRESLFRVPLRRFSGIDDLRFATLLDTETDRIRRGLPPLARSWGLARKCLNIFLRDCTYNVHLRKAFKLSSIEALLEVPLDRKVVSEIKAEFPKRALPFWRGVRHLDPGESEVFQVAASEIATVWSIDRIHLDAAFWSR